MTLQGLLHAGLRILRFASLFGFRTLVHPLVGKALAGAAYLVPSNANLARAFVSADEFFPRKISSLIPAKMTRITHADPHTVVFNPSILETNGSKTLLVCMTENNRIMDFSLQPPPGLLDGGPYRSQLVFFEMETADLEKSNSGHSPRRLRSVTNSANDDDKEFADARLFRVGDEIAISFSYSSKHGFEDGSSHRIGVSKFGPEKNEVNCSQIISSPLSRPVEKNWMPVSDDSSGKIRFVYQVSPTLTIEFDESSKKQSSPKILEQSAPRELNSYRGGSPLRKIPGSNLFICVAHKTRMKPVRNYIHRFIIFEDSPAGMRITGFSSAFYFLNPLDIEFSSGLAIAKDSLIVSFGFRDREGWICSVELGNLLVHIKTD